MSKPKGCKNKTLRKDTKQSREMILQALEPLQGVHVTANMLLQFMKIKRTPESVNAVLRQLVAEQILERQGRAADPRGFIYTILN
jgi:hypothetical protein